MPRRSVRSASAFASAAPPSRSSSNGRPTSASSAAKRTSTSPEPHRDIGTVGDQSRDPWVGEETGDAALVVDGPDPGINAVPRAVTQHGQAGQLLVDGDEVGV